MVMIRSTSQGGAGPFPHLVRYLLIDSLPSSSLPLELTQGQYEVTEINAWDESAGIV